MSFIATQHTERIVSAAVELFKAKGFDQVSISEISKAAGFSRSVFYASFSSKAQIIEYLLDQALQDQNPSFGAFIEAPNDFERMWILCDRYLSVALRLGPKLFKTLLQLDLDGKIDIYGKVSEVNDWMIRLMRNCQQTGVILNPEPAEEIAPLAVSAVYQVCYEWGRENGHFSLRERARKIAETVFIVAPEYRRSHELQESADNH